MKSNTNFLLIICILVVTSGCAQNPNRAGCSFIGGDGRYGTFTQYAKGDVKGVHIYIGENIENVSITCNANTQEITVATTDKVGID